MESSFFRYLSFFGVKNYKFTAKTFLLDQMILWSPHQRKDRKCKEYWISLILQHTFLQKYNAQLFQLGFNQKPSTVTRGFHWKMIGFHLCIRILKAPYWNESVNSSWKILDFQNFYLFKFLAGFLPTWSYLEAFNLYRTKTLENCWLCSRHQNLGNPRTSKKLIFSFVSIFKLTFFRNYMPVFFHSRTVSVEKSQYVGNPSMKNFRFWSILRNPDSPTKSESAIKVDSYQKYTLFLRFYKLNFFPSGPPSEYFNSHNKFELKISFCCLLQNSDSLKKPNCADSMSSTPPSNRFFICIDKLDFFHENFNRKFQPCWANNMTQFENIDG